MTILLNLIITLFASLSILASGYLIYKGLKENKGLEFFLGSLFFFPLFILTCSLLFETRVGHWNMYTWLYPVGLLCILRSAFLLQISKGYRLVFILALSLGGFFHYFKMFNEDSVRKVIQLKQGFLKKNNLVVNVFLTPAHPFNREVANYYGKAHRSYNTIVLNLPLDHGELGKLFDIHKLFNAVNIILVENDPIEKQGAEKIKDIILKNFDVETKSFLRTSVSEHPYLKKKKIVIENILYVKKD